MPAAWRDGQSNYGGRLPRARFDWLKQGYVAFVWGRHFCGEQQLLSNVTGRMITIGDAAQRKRKLYALRSKVPGADQGGPVCIPIFCQPNHEILQTKCTPLKCRLFNADRTARLDKWAAPWIW